MKVLKNNKSPSEPEFPVQVTCPKCGSELEAEKSDVEYSGGFGTAMVTCPVCGERVDLPDEYCVDPNIDNITYPTSYYRTNVEEGASHILPDRIDRNVREGIRFLKKHASQEGNYWYTEFGDCFILVQDYPGDEEYVVTVSQDYRQVYLPYTDEDFQLHNCPIYDNDED